MLCHDVLVKDCSMPQARRQATANARGLMVTVFVVRMNRSPDAAERRCDRPAIELTGIQYLDRYEGADPRECTDARERIV